MEETSSSNSNFIARIAGLNNSGVLSFQKGAAQEALQQLTRALAQSRKCVMTLPRQHREPVDADCDMKSSDMNCNGFQRLQECLFSVTSQWTLSEDTMIFNEPLLITEAMIEGGFTSPANHDDSNITACLAIVLFNLALVYYKNEVDNGIPMKLLEKAAQLLLRDSSPHYKGGNQATEMVQDLVLMVILNNLIQMTDPNNENAMHEYLQGLFRASKSLLDTTQYHSEKSKKNMVQSVEKFRSVITTNAMIRCFYSQLVHHASAA